MILQPVTYRDACAFIREHHRHHRPPQGWRFGIGLMKEGRLVGVLTAGRPVARRLDHTWTLEITRLCTDGTRNACSQLYAAAVRAALAMGYRRIITYTLESESGASLKAAGFKFAGIAGGKSWSVPSRPREDKAPAEMKKLWEIWAHGEGSREGSKAP